MNAWIVETLVSSSLLMAFVLLVRRPVAKAFGSRVAYGLWLLPALRMILPPLIGHRALYVPVMVIDPAVRESVRVGLAPPAAVVDRFVLPAPMTSGLEVVPHAVGFDWVPLLLGLWLAGAAVFFGWQMLGYRLFVRQALARSVRLSRICKVDVLTSERVSGPVAIGILRRRILLPVDFLGRYSSAERRQALLHEGAHHDRGDLIANFVAQAVLALHWWNPLAHIAHRAFRSDQELACDATVLADADGDALYAYGSALVKSTSGRVPAAACALDRATEIKRRLKMIKRGRIALPRRLAGMLLAGSAIGFGLFVSASGSQAAERVGAAGKAIVAPLAPLPPLAPVAAIAPPTPLAPVAPIRPAPPQPHALPPLPPLSPAETARIDAQMERSAALAEQAGARAAAAGERAAQAGAMASAHAADAARRGALMRVSVEDARLRMMVSCSQQGHPVAAAERDWRTLALCGQDFRPDMRIALQNARTEIARNTQMSDEDRTRAQAAIDRAIARMEGDRP